MALTERYVSSLAAGGGSGTEGSPWTFAEAVSNYAAGDRINIKADGTYTFTASVTFTTAATDTAPVVWRGYGTTPGDGIRPTLNFDVADWHTARFIGLNLALTFESLAITKSALDGNELLDVAGSVVVDCSVKHTNPTHDYGGAGISAHVVVGCDVEVGGNGVYLKAASGAAGSVAAHNRIVASNGVVLPPYQAGSVICNVVKASRTGVGAGVSIDDIGLGYPVHVFGNAIYDYVDGIAVADGPEVAGASEVLAVVNNIIYTCSGYGIENTAGTDNARTLIKSNAIGNCTSGNYSGFGDVPILDHITLTADPFVDAANGDFRLNDAAGGGRLCKFAGLEAPTS